jgi:hypothetical protein
LWSTRVVGLVIRVSHAGDAACNVARCHADRLFFIYGYFLLALRRFLLPVMACRTLALLVGFITLSLALTSYAPA